MRAYRVFPYLSAARRGDPGHAEYVGQQGSGRLDNPDHYEVRYLAEAPVTAVAERFGELVRWTPAMFRHVRGASLALATFEVPDSLRRVDLDDARALADRRLRPTQVVRRHLPTTQAWALDIFREKVSARGGPRWDGVRWWSWYRPEWPVLGLWRGEPELLSVEPLGLDHPAVREAALALGRPLR